MSKILSKDMTSYDVLKTVAVIIMIIDHIGYYFFTDDMWWRAVGRIGFPVWFFLIGHATGRGIPSKLWGGALFLAALYLFAGSHVFPLSALVTIIFIRLTLDWVMRYALLNKVAIILTSAALVLLILPSSFLFEYGTQAIILAMFGYMVRHKDRLALSGDFLRNFAVFSFFAFVLPQFVLHGLSMPQFYLMAAGTAATVYTLFHFKAASYPALTAKMPAPLAWLVRFGGRRTLEIYVVHIALFQVAAVLMGQERFGWFDWKFIPEF